MARRDKTLILRNNEYCPRDHKDNARSGLYTFHKDLDSIRWILLRYFWAPLALGALKDKRIWESFD
jgi:hypothetical protein